MVAGSSPAGGTISILIFDFVLINNVLLNTDFGVLIMSNIDTELDNIIICLYTLENASEDDCISSSLHSLYTISLYLGVRIRYSTLQSLTNYVREWSSLDELEQELVIDLLRNLIESYKVSDYARVKDITKRIFRMLIGTGIDTKTVKDAIELTLNTLYAVLVASVADVVTETTLLQVQGAPAISKVHAL